MLMCTARLSPARPVFVGPVQSQKHSHRAVGQTCRPAAHSFKQAGAAALSALILLTSAPVHAEAPAVLQGPARAVDGDTLVVQSQRIRLYGVDAPESAQQCLNPSGKEYPCGLVSKDALAKKIGSAPVTCTVKNQDQYGRNVSVCSVSGLLPGQSEDLNAWLVSNGHAVAYRQFGKEYIPLEDAAKASKQGIWAGTFQMPSDWRKQNKRKETTVAPAVPFSMPPTAMLPAAASLGRADTAGQPTCAGAAGVIKGNISSAGAKIYHKPGGKYYEAVRIDVADGEKYFCSEQEAQAAGWRASKQ